MTDTATRPAIPAIHRTDYAGASGRAPLLGVLASHLSARVWFRRHYIEWAPVDGCPACAALVELPPVPVPLWTYDEDGHPV